MQEISQAYGGAIEAGHNIMDAHLNIGKILKQLSKPSGPTTSVWSMPPDLLSYPMTRVQKLK